MSHLLFAAFVLAVSLIHVECFYKPLRQISPLRLRVSSYNDIQESDTRARNLIAVARLFATTNLGITNSEVLTDDFICSGPNFDDIGKKKYLADLIKETTAIQRAIPDYDIRPHSFRVDEFQTDVDVVWFKIKPKGILTGPYVYKGETYLPNQKLLELPLQQLSVTINSSGQISRVTAGYTIDRFSSNTGGLAGPLGILYALGEAPSKFLYLPPAVVIRQFFGRTSKLIQRKAVKVSPFPVAVMISLAKRVVETTLGAEEPELLSSDFQFSGPLVGPLQKDAFVNALARFDLKTPFPNLKSESYNYEVDSFDPERVWVISQSTGTQAGPLVLGGKEVQKASYKKFVGPPEAVSVSFNEQGLCYRATGGYILDKKKGNTKGLGGVYGIFEAIGCPLPWWESRSIGDLPLLMKESVLSSFSPAEDTTKNAPSISKKPVIERAAFVPSNPPETVAEVPRLAVDKPRAPTPVVSKTVSAPIYATKDPPAPVPVKPPAPSKAVSAPIKAVSSPVIAMETPIKSDPKLPSFNNPFAKKATPTPLVVGDDSKVAKESKEKEKKISKPSQQAVQVDKIGSVSEPIPPKKKSRFESIFSVDYSKRGTATLKTGSKKVPNSNGATLKTDSKKLPNSNEKPKK